MASKHIGSSEPPEVQAARLTSRSGLVMALIGALGVIVGAFASPLADRWVNHPPSTAGAGPVPIEQFSQQVFAYQGLDEGSPGWGDLTLSYSGSPARLNYIFHYNLLADQQQGYAGLAFKFDESRNLSAYRAIEFILHFAEPGTAIEFYLQDVTGKEARVRIVGKEGEMQLHYDLSNFADANLNAIEELGLIAGREFTSGSHAVTLSGLRLIR